MWALCQVSRPSPGVVNVWPRRARRKQLPSCRNLRQLLKWLLPMVAEKNVAYRRVKCCGDDSLSHLAINKIHTSHGPHQGFSGSSTPNPLSDDFVAPTNRPAVEELRALQPEVARCCKFQENWSDAILINIPTSRPELKKIDLNPSRKGWESPKLGNIVPTLHSNHSNPNLLCPHFLQNPQLWSETDSAKVSLKLAKRPRAKAADCWIEATLSKSNGLPFHQLGTLVTKSR